MGDSFTSIDHIKYKIDFTIKETNAPHTCTLGRASPHTRTLARASLLNSEVDSPDGVPLERGKRQCSGARKRAKVTIKDYTTCFIFLKLKGAIELGDVSILLSKVIERAKKWQAIEAKPS